MGKPFPFLLHFAPISSVLPHLAQPSHFFGSPCPTIPFLGSPSPIIPFLVHFAPPSPFLVNLSPLYPFLFHFAFPSRFLVNLASLSPHLPHPALQDLSLFHLALFLSSTNYCLDAFNLNDGDKIAAERNRVLRTLGQWLIKCVER